MDAFGFLLISLLSLPLIDGQNVIVSRKEGNISQTLDVTIVFEEDDSRPGVCLQVLVDGMGVQPTWHNQDRPGLQFIPRTDNMLSKQVYVTFNCSKTDLFASPVNVTTSIFSTAPNVCEPDQDNLLSKKTTLLYDDRVSVEWLLHSKDCYVNQSCSFSAKIVHSSRSWKGPLHLTVNVTQTAQDSQIRVISPINSENAEVKFVHTFGQVGTFTAVLSVPNKWEKNVYWKQQSLEINVKTDMLLKLEKEVDYLKSQVIDLNYLVGNLTEVIEKMPCQLRECGKYSDCVDGRCECTLPQVYNGSKCMHFVGCENSPKACGNGEYGECREPDNPSADNLYSCYCNDENVSGQDCNECRGGDSFCNNHGTCTVEESGEPTCHCNSDFTGPNCEKCTRHCGHGHCVVENDLPTCECDTNFELVDSKNCDKCVDGWTGPNCDQPDCSTTNKTHITVICNGGGCNEKGTGCDCKETNSTGAFCQYKKCNETSAKKFCKGSGGSCVHNSTGPKDIVCYCHGGFVVASNETCSESPSPTPPSPTPPSATPPSPTPPFTTPPPAHDPCDSSPCNNGHTCSPNRTSNGYACQCPPGFKGDNCDNKIEEEKSVSSPTPPANQSDNNSQLLYGGLAVFIAVLVVCVVAYLAYHNREKILELFGRRKESVVEMAMRSRTKSKGYKKLPTSIHDTLTHED